MRKVKKKLKREQVLEYNYVNYAANKENIYFNVIECNVIFFSLKFKHGRD